jgi:hypothetical protein
MAMPRGAVEAKFGQDGRVLGPSLMTPLGVISGDVLAYMDGHKRTTLRRLIRELQWPAALVMMGVGALIREGLLRGVQRDLDVVLEPGS